MFVALALLVAAIMSGVFLAIWLLDVSFIKAFGLVQATVTVLAISAGAIFAFYKLEIFREFQPHLTITQETAHRRVGDSYVHVSVHAKLVNNSKVKIEIRDASFWMQQVAPFPDDEIEELFSNFEAQPSSEKYFSYPTLVEFEREWDEDEFVIEPGETASERFEFVVKDEFDAVSITAFFYDQTTGADRTVQKGWAVESVYDIK